MNSDVLINMITVRRRVRWADPSIHFCPHETNSFNGNSWMCKQTYQYFNLLEWHERETCHVRCDCFDTSNLFGVVNGAIKV
jgi:hypothetical protein